MPRDMFGRKVPDLGWFGPREGLAPEWAAKDLLPVNRLRPGQVYDPPLPFQMQRDLDDRERQEYAARVNPHRFVTIHGHVLRRCAHGT